MAWPALNRRGLLTLGLGAALPAQGAEVGGAVASFSILGDFVRQLAGPTLPVQTLLGPGADPHDFAPRPSHAVALRQAALVVRNGLGLEPWLDRLLASAQPRGLVVTASAGLGLPPGADPHAWLNPAVGQHYARSIGAGLAQALPNWPLNPAFASRLAALDAWMADEFASVPAARRVFVCGHAAFGHLAQRFGLEMLAPQGESAGAVAAIVRQVRQRGLRALFATGADDARLMAQLAAAAGVPLAGRLYAESLSPPGGPAATYEALMRHNTALMVSAMRG